MEFVKELIKARDQSRKEQAPWLEMWDDLSAAMAPRRLGFASDQSEGDVRTGDIFDGTPMTSARRLSNAISGMLFPAGQPFVKIVASDQAINEDDEARRWLDDSNARLDRAINNPKAQLSRTRGEAILDLVTLGTGIMMVTEAKTRQHLLYRALSLHNVTVDWDEDGNVSRIWRTEKIDLRAAEAELGFDNLSDTVKKQIQSKRLDQKIELVHAVLPANDRLVRGNINTNFPTASLWFEVKTHHLARTSGFHEMPFIAPRFDTMSGEKYGRSPGMLALPDANTLNAIGDTVLTAAEKLADPPLMAPNDGSFSEANTFSGGISYYDVELAREMRGNPIFPLQTGGNIPVVRDMQDDMRLQVQAAFYRNEFNLPPAVGTPMTATEVIARREEFIREVGPVFGGLITGFGPLWERSFNIMLRAGQFADIPDILSGQDISFEYENPILRTREQIEAAAARDWVLELMEMAQMKPEVLDHVDLDEYARFVGVARGVPVRLIASQQNVEGVRAERRQMQQMATELDAAKQAADVGHTVASAAEKAGMTEQVA